MVGVDPIPLSLPLLSLTRSAASAAREFLRAGVLQVIQRVVAAVVIVAVVSGVSGC